MIVNQALTFLLLLANLILISKAIDANFSNNSTCNRSCGEGESAQVVNYPFGFTEGCEIQLNCSARTRQIHLAGYQVKNLTPDSITVNFPANCTRSVTDIRVLFGENYAPSWLNGLRLYNCSLSQAAGGCVIPASLLQSQLDARVCDTGSGMKFNTSCYAAQDRGSGILSYGDILGTGCRTLFSSFVVKSTSERLLVSDVTLEFQAIQLAWWVPGQCQCVDQADCAAVQSVNGSDGFRCQCRDGFSGDGFIRGNGCQRDRKDGSDVAALVGGIIGGASSFLAILAVICYFIRKRTKISWRSRRNAKRLLSEASGSSSLRLYPYKEIERATSGFSEKQRVGMGAYGTVYSGKFDDEWVAIKRINHRDSDSIELVMNEIKLLSSVSHPNLVRLLGCCIEHGEQILVYEYMPNGTLAQHLQREKCDALPWIVRLSIATETAQAIAYLHSVINPPIYHRDIKTSNILLGPNYNSKVADFGLSRLGMMEMSMSHISTAPQGTPGYVDPQYHQNFHLSDKSDVYSFGVVLVEILTAMKVVDFSRPNTEVNLAAMAVDRIGKGRLDEILDPYLDLTRDAWTLSSVHKVAELAFQCLAYHKDMRPSMMEVADELERIRQSGCPSYEDMNMCMGSVTSSVCSSPSLRSLDSLSFKKAREVASRRLFVPPKVASDCLGSLAQVKESSPVSVQDEWLSEQSSPSATSLLSSIGVP